MRTFQPYLHLHETSADNFDVEALVAIPDGWKFQSVNEVTSHNVDGERLILIALEEDDETQYDGTFQISFSMDETDSEMKILVEVGSFNGEETLYDVFGNAAVYLADSTSGEESADRNISGGGKTKVTSSTQVIRDPV